MTLGTGATLAMAATSMNRKVDEDEIKEALSTIKTQSRCVKEGLQLLRIMVLDWLH
jgi:2-haloacid dehalogenase